MLNNFLIINYKLSELDVEIIQKWFACLILMDRIKLANYKEHFCQSTHFTSPIFSFFELQTFENLMNYFSFDNSLSKEVPFQTAENLKEILLKLKKVFELVSIPSSEENKFSLIEKEAIHSDDMRIFLFKLRQIENFDKTKTAILIGERAEDGYIYAAWPIIQFTEQKLFEAVIDMIQNLARTKDIMAFEQSRCFTPNFIRKIVDNSNVMVLNFCTPENYMSMREYELIQFQTNTRLFIICNPFSWQLGSFIFTNIRTEPLLKMAVERILKRPLFIDSWTLDSKLFGNRSWSLDLLAFILESSIKNTFLVYYEFNSEKYTQNQFTKFRDLLAQKLQLKDDQNELLADKETRISYSESEFSSHEKEENFCKRKTIVSEGRVELSHFLKKIGKDCKRFKNCQKKGKKSNNKYIRKTCTAELGRDRAFCVDDFFALTIE